MKSQVLNNYSANIRNSFERFSPQTQLDAEYLTGGLALLPHAAYHLGSIRQMVERVRQRKIN